MIGGIYSDLAASTYLRDPKVFYKQLFDEKSTISGQTKSSVEDIIEIIMQY